MWFWFSFAQFFSDASNLLVHLSSDIGDFTPGHLESRLGAPLGHHESLF